MPAKLIPPMPIPTRTSRKPRKAEGFLAARSNILMPQPPPPAAAASAASAAAVDDAHGDGVCGRWSMKSWLWEILLAYDVAEVLGWDGSFRRVFSEFWAVSKFRNIPGNFGHFLGNFGILGGFWAV